jgi:Spy/CpxP family protein refolding chaperone
MLLLPSLLLMLGGAPAFAHSPASASSESRSGEIDKLASQLQLDAAASARLHQTFDKYRALLAPLRRDDWQTRRALRQELGRSQPDDHKLRTLTDQLTSDRQRMRSIAEQRAGELKQELTPAQYAQLVLSRHELGRRGRRMHEPRR